MIVPASQLAERARALISQLGDATSLEQIWELAAVKTMARGLLIDPSSHELKRLTTPWRAWSDFSPWPMDAFQDRIGRLMDTHRLAIVQDDAAWLMQLDATWEDAPSIIGACWPLRAQGEIGLGLGASGQRPYGWTSEEMAVLEEESFLQSVAPSDRAWRALTVQDLDGARSAIKDYEAHIATVWSQWEIAPEAGLRQIRTYPGVALQIELRSLQILVARARARKA